MPRLRGQPQKKKKCVKATAFPCGFTCLPRMAKSGKEVRCRHTLRGQADTATKWLKQLEERMSAVNQKRAVKGRSSLFIDPKGSLRQGQSTINPSGLNDKELVKAFLAEKKNGQSKTLLAALGKEIDRRNLQQKANQARLLARKTKDPKVREKASRIAEHFEKMSSALAVIKNHVPDKNGYLLKDKNFEKADFEDFDIPAKVFKSEVEAKKVYRELAKRYHPDLGGSAEQMANLNILFDQILDKIRKDRERKGRSPTNPKQKKSPPKKTPKDSLKDINEQLGKQADQELECLFG